MTFTVEHQRVVVVGGGRSGLSAAALLASRGASVTLSDSASTLDGADRLRDLGVHVELGPHRPELLAAADLIVLSPGVPPDAASCRGGAAPACRDGRDRTGRALDQRRIVAITGTKGKSTTTTLTARMLQAAGMPAVAGRNLGIARRAGRRVASRHGHVVEVSSFQLERQNVSSVGGGARQSLGRHLDRHASFGSTPRQKARIFANQRPEDWAIVNADDAASVALASRAPARGASISRSTRRLPTASPSTASHIVRRDAGVSTRSCRAALHLPGRHLLADVLRPRPQRASWARRPPPSGGRWRRFRGLEHALEQTGEVGGVRFVNDSKATNIASARRALEASIGASSRSWADSKGGDFAELSDVPRRVWMPSSRLAKPATALRPRSARPCRYHAASMREPCTRSRGPTRRRGAARAACSSFDMLRTMPRARASKTENRAGAGRTGNELVPALAP